MGTLAYIGRRLALMVPTLIGVTLVSFVLTRIVPGNPIDQLVQPMATAAQRLAVAKEYGLAAPLPVQYLNYLVNLLHGNLGTSFTTGDPVAQDLSRFFGATLELTTYATLWALVAGFVLGVASAVHRDTWVDSLARVVSVSGISIPVFWLALLLIYFLFARLHVLPGPVGRLNPYLTPPKPITGFYVIDSLLERNWVDFRSSVSLLIMPVFCLGFGAMAPIARMVRSGMIEALDAPYLVAAKALGVPAHIRVWSHALRNALLPVITTIALVIGFELGGSVLVENLFAWPGLGRYAYNAIAGTDYPAIQGFILYETALYLAIFLLADIAYAFFDPRVQH